MRFLLKLLGLGIAFSVLGLGLLFVPAPGLHGSSILQSAYSIVENSGTALFRRQVLNFTGAGVSCADNGGTGTTDCTVSGSGTVVHSIGAGFDGGGSAISVASVTYFTVPYGCTIQAWNITVDTGTITFDVWKIASGTAIPTVANTIVSAAPPAISSGTAVHSTTLTGWTTTVTANDIFGIEVSAVASAKKASLVLQCQ